MLSPEEFRRRLAEWYDVTRRDLPWRRTRDPYLIWISEVMLQQTQVQTVIPYFERFVERYPTIDDLERADLQAVLKAWEGLGYYQRARNLHRAAAEIVRRHGGIVPNTPETFRRLPGAGEYITAAVMSIAFDHPIPVVDGNVKRVLARVFTLDAATNSPSAKVTSTFAERAKALLPPERPGDHNQAMMELGALVCAPRAPRCEACPVAGLCRAHQSGVVKDYPRRVVKPPVPSRHIAVGVIRRRGCVLITRRKPRGLLGGLFEFPGGKVERGETAEEACQREIREEVGLMVTVDSHLTTVRHAYTHFKIVMDVFLCSCPTGRVRLNGPVSFKWIKPEEIERYPFPKANHKFIPLLLRSDPSDPA